MGNRLKNLHYAIYKIEEELGTVIEKSSIWSTAAWGVTDQPDFLNMAIALQTPCTPEEILVGIQAIEHRLGRVRTQHWGSRTIDIDIIFFNNMNLDVENLIIPHKFMAERNFVLYPLEEICPDYIHPLLNKTVRQLKKECTDTSQINKFE